MFPASVLEGKQSYYKPNSNLHCWPQPVSQAQLGKAMFPACCPRTAPHAQQDMPLPRGIRRCGAAGQSPSSSAGSLQPWQEKESAFFSTRREKPFPFCSQQTIPPEGRGMLMARICSVDNKQLPGPQSSLSNARGHKSDGKDRAERALKAFAMTNRRQSCLRAAPSLLSVLAHPFYRAHLALCPLLCL